MLSRIQQSASQSYVTHRCQVILSGRGRWRGGAVIRLSRLRRQLNLWLLGWVSLLRFLNHNTSRPSRRKWMQPGVVVVFVGCCCCDTVVNTWMGADIFVSSVVDFGLNPINADWVLIYETPGREENHRLQQDIFLMIRWLNVIYIFIYIIYKDIFHQ